VRALFTIALVNAFAHLAFVQLLLVSWPRLRKHQDTLRALALMLGPWPLVGRVLVQQTGASWALSFEAAAFMERGIVGLSTLLTLPVVLLLRRALRAPAPRVEPAPKVPPPATAAGNAEAAPEQVPRREALVRGITWGTFAGAGTMLGWGMTKGRLGFELEEVVVRIPGLPRVLDGYTIAQISDVHVGAFMQEAELRAGFETLRAARADLVVCTGDLVDIDPRQTALFARMLDTVQARDGKYAVIGNHEYYAGKAEVMRQLRAAGIPVLFNQGVRVRAGDAGGFALLGVDDEMGAPDLDLAISQVPQELPRILLAHRPDFFLRSAGRVALQLSGHTHGGQIAPMGITPASALLRFNRGRYDRDRSVLWVNRGFGVAAVPARMGVPPEVTKIVLVAG
jgi:predicted MPP superfamily phosphohydrolase